MQSIFFSYNVFYAIPRGSFWSLRNINLKGHALALIKVLKWLPTFLKVWRTNSSSETEGHFMLWNLLSSLTSSFTSRPLTFHTTALRNSFQSLLYSVLLVFTSFFFSDLLCAPIAPWQYNYIHVKTVYLIVCLHHWIVCSVRLTSHMFDSQCSLSNSRIPII